MIDDVRRIAHELGYAVAVHGSLGEHRDIDLIAAPWVSRARAAATLAARVGELPYLTAHIVDNRRAHGRRAWTWYITRRAAGCPRYVDLSVMPRGRDRNGPERG